MPQFSTGNTMLYTHESMVMTGGKNSYANNDFIPDTAVSMKPKLFKKPKQVAKAEHIKTLLKDKNLHIDSMRGQLLNKILSH